jgi:RNA polymerase I-specific transcription initiation factor RRN3
MVSIITENFPHKSEDVQAHVWYVKNVLRIVKYAPVLRNPLWALLIDRAVNIDVSSWWFTVDCKAQRILTLNLSFLL